MEGRPGLILVEVKANVPELGVAGKLIAPDASKNSLENHERIGRAIAEARAGPSAHLPGIAISATSHYQPSNRLAFAWKLATLGIPTVLIHLGLTGDEGLQGVGAPFENDAHGQRRLYTGVRDRDGIGKLCTVTGCPRRTDVRPQHLRRRPSTRIVSVPVHVGIVGEGAHAVHRFWR